MLAWWLTGYLSGMAAPSSLNLSFLKMAAQPNSAPTRTKVDADFGAVTTHLSAVATTAGSSYTGQTQAPVPAGQSVLFNASADPEVGELLIQFENLNPPPGQPTWYAATRPLLVRASGGLGYVVPAEGGTHMGPGNRLGSFNWRVLWVAKQNATVTVTSQPYTA